MAKDQAQIKDEFYGLVNMTPKQLDDWLETEEAKDVGQEGGGGESKGHKSGRRILKILGKNKSDLTDDDLEHMNKVVSYIKRHSAQGPSDTSRRAIGATH